MGFAVIFIPALVVLVFTNILKLFYVLVWRPYSITKFFENQGIKGPPYKILYGSLPEIKKLRNESANLVLDTYSNDVLQTATPYIHKWPQQYGEVMLYWAGIEPRITVSGLDMAKQILSNKFGFYRRSRVQPLSKIIMGGKGLIFVEGEEWVRQRRILNPAFSLEKLKMMKKEMAECTISMLNGWRNKALEAKSQCIEIEMGGEFMKLTSDIIARTAFGSSYVEGQEAFKAQKELQNCVVASHVEIFIPGTQYIPTPSNIRIWKLDRKLKNTIRRIVEGRLEQVAKSPDGGYGDDLLGVMIESSEIAAQTKVIPKLSMDEILENCKAFFFSGHETTYNFLTWSVFLLSRHQEWQQRLREEVLNECEMQIPDADMLSKLRLVNMFLLEVLRLYNPVIATFRAPMQDTKLGNLRIPKGTALDIPFHKIQRDKEIWGEDALEFKPYRFENGIAKAAKHPNAFISFSMGPRNCIGQNFAMLEAKLVIALILQRFSLSLSPHYKHAPFNYVTLHPRYGMPILVKPFSS